MSKIHLHLYSHLIKFILLHISGKDIQIHKTYIIPLIVYYTPLLFSCVYSIMPTQQYQNFILELDKCCQQLAWHKIHDLIHHNNLWNFMASRQKTFVLRQQIVPAKMGWVDFQMIFRIKGTRPICGWNCKPI